MSRDLAVAVGAISAACLAYTVGVWAERLEGRLRGWHLGCFGAGLLLDGWGTAAMGRLAGGVWRLDVHTVTGVTALVLMGLHAAWAAVTLLRGDEPALRRFHRVSLAVWLAWLVPFLSGPFLARR